MLTVQLLWQSSRIRITCLLLLMTAFCFTISVIRIIVTDTPVFLFLNWNLLLAMIPWVISSAMIIVPAFRKNKLLLVGLVATWILFFPNSPYILTDLFHLRVRAHAPIWFDLVVILSFAWAGLVFGFQSLFDIELVLLQKLKPAAVNAISSLLLFIGAFGVYIGRYLRWNSWDLVGNPLPLMSEVGDRLINPLDHPSTWGMTILMGIFLNMIYWTIKLMKNNKELAGPENTLSLR